MADISDINSALQTKIVGQDGTGLETNPVNATTFGLQVDVQTSVLPTGAATSSNQTTEITALQLIDNPVGSVGAGAAGTSSFLAGLVFNTALPTLTNGQQAALQGDSNARLIIAPLTNASVVKVQLQDNAGTAITLGQKVMSSSVPITIASDQTPLQVVGNVGSGATDSGNPLKIGGVFNTTQPTVTTGQRVDFQATNRGAMIVATGVDNFKVQLQDNAGNGITSASPGTSGDRRLHVATPDITVAAVALNALNANISIPLAGESGAGFQISAGTLIGTLTAESSLDGGTSWDTCNFIDSSTNSVSNSYVFTSANGFKTLSILPVNGASHARVRVSAYTSGTANGILRASQVKGPGQAVTTTQVVSSLPAAQVTADKQINTGVTTYTSYTATQKIAIKQFYAAGTGIGQQRLFYYFPSTTQFVNAGDFETPADINTTWTFVSNGAVSTIASSTAQFFTGARSVSLTFTQSDANHYNGIKQTFSSPVDISTWRYVTAEFFNVVSGGGAYTRTISIILTDTASNTLKFDVSGSSTTSPFNASNWIKITGEIQNPTSTTGTGFDLTQVASIELRMTDSANKSGTVYWDTVQFEAQLTLILPIFHSANVSLNVAIDPVAVLNSGSQIIIAQTNGDTARKEYFALVGGVAI